MERTPFSEKCINSVFERQAEADPRRVALLYERQFLTFGDLNVRANKLARFLQGQGVGPEELVGVFLENSLEGVVALMSILKAGGGCVPLDPSQPLERLAHLIVDSKLSLIVTTGQLASRLPSCRIEVICLDLTAPQIESESSANLRSRTSPNNIAFVIYTSGSTGEPKGVARSHCGISIHEESLQPNDICCVNMPFSVGFSLQRLFVPLMAGVRSVIIPLPRVKDPNELATALEASQATNIALAPSSLRQLLNLNPQIISRLFRLRTVTIGGSSASQDLIDSFRRLMPQAKLFIQYGASETGPIATGEATDKSNSSPTSIGRPLSDKQIYIVDKSMHDVPLGTTGELYIAGPLARGYIGRSGLTAERFIPNPFGKAVGSRLYRTGDRGRLLPTGEIELLGRSDRQVKIRGFRVEPGEIESVLAKHQGICDASVTPRYSDGEQQLVAYVVSKSGMRVTVEELQHLVRMHLPEHMVPSIYMFLDRLPRTISGKVDWSALPNPAATRSHLRSAFQPATNLVEAAIAAIWSHLLGLEQLGINDDVFDLGGDSLIATRVVSRIRNMFDCELSLASIFDHPTVAEQSLEVIAEVGIPAKLNANSRENPNGVPEGSRIT